MPRASATLSIADHSERCRDRTWATWATARARKGGEYLVGRLMRWMLLCSRTGQARMRFGFQALAVAEKTRWPSPGLNLWPHSGPAVFGCGRVHPPPMWGRRRLWHEPAIPATGTRKIPYCSCVSAVHEPQWLAAAPSVRRPPRKGDQTDPLGRWMATPSGLHPADECFIQVTHHCVLHLIWHAACPHSSLSASTHGRNACYVHFIFCVPPTFRDQAPGACDGLTTFRSPTPGLPSGPHLSTGLRLCHFLVPIAVFGRSGHPTALSCFCSSVSPGRTELACSGMACCVAGGHPGSCVCC
ncbi:hypothetical protein Ga0074812_103331 [Parafrankia irregularis]|uniref:Uncharacterized protein n=1 Tax=Parafrankia irregularis TaxID=795642 RepID=A0A0S4QHT7_9ACTN|nr:hypothetical protein Ga0074812_103331 [Parafrankia irregularis]